MLQVHSYDIEQSIVYHKRLSHSAFIAKRMLLTSWKSTITLCNWMTFPFRHLGFVLYLNEAPDPHLPHIYKLFYINEISEGHAFFYVFPNLWCWCPFAFLGTHYNHVIVTHIPENSLWLFFEYRLVCLAHIPCHCENLKVIPTFYNWLLFYELFLRRFRFFLNPLWDILLLIGLILIHLKQLRELVLLVYITEYNSVINILLLYEVQDLKLDTTVVNKT